jgi:hypothetical protein
MAVQLVQHHSHFGAFQAEVDDGRMVGVRPALVEIERCNEQVPPVRAFDPPALAQSTA